MLTTEFRFLALQRERMQQLRKKIVRFIQEQGLFMPGETVVLACSGGADSMALLDILANLPGFPLTLVAAHLNHMLRAGEADADEQFVRSAASRYDIQLEVSRVDVASFATVRRVSLEEAGREARYGFFREISAKYSATAIAVGHHRDDQAETVLLRLIRGAAGSGLAGMRPKAGGIVRPLLQVSRAWIEAYLKKGGLVWREDKSNADTRFLRNRIRHELLPLLETFNPEIVQSLSQAAEVLAADEDALCGLTADAFTRLATSGDSSVRFDPAALYGEPTALRKRLYRAAISSVKGELRRISFAHLADIDKLARSPAPNAELNLPCRVRVVRAYDSLIFTEYKDEPLPQGYELAIEGCGRYSLPCGGLISVTSADDAEGRVGSALLIDPSKLPLPWTVRYLCPADRFRPLGMEGTKKLKDLFIDRKVPLQQRARIPLLLCRDEIFWVCGVQPAENARTVAGSGQQPGLRIMYTPASISH